MRRVFCRPRKTGSVRRPVPRAGAFSLSLRSGWPADSSVLGLPISERFSPPRSKTRSTLPGSETSQRCRGSRYGRTPLVLRVSSGVGGGKVRRRSGLPSAS